MKLKSINLKVKKNTAKSKKAVFQIGFLPTKEHFLMHFKSWLLYLY